MNNIVKALSALTLFLCLHFGALAQFDAADSYMNDIQPIEIDGKFEPMGEGLAGDSIEHDRGTLSFYHVDVDIPGNSNLPVRFARSYTIHGTAYTGNHLGGWQIDVPFITTRMRVALNSPGATGHPNSPPRCFLEGWDRAGANFDDTSAFYQGFKMHIPGEGMKQIMDIPAGASTNFPYEGQHAVTKTTADHWKIYCEESGGVKTGNVIAVSPSGDKYEFRTLSLTQAGPEVISVSTGGRRGTLTDEIVLTYHHNLLATKVTDVHGNWVAFDYEHEFDYEFLDQYQTVATRDYDSFRLKTIRGNDGRRIDLSYNGANYPGQTIPGGTVQTIDEGKTTTIASVTAHGRT